MSRYVDALAEYRRKYIPGGPEVLLQLGDNGAREAFRLYRVDLASGATTPPNLTEVNLASIPQLHRRAEAAHRFGLGGERSRRWVARESARHAAIE
jgi:hypothetical protein